MNKYVKEFFHRGLVFSGFGPIIFGIVIFIVSKTTDNLVLSGGEVLTGIVSTYLLAFAHAGASVFNQIEHWSIGKSLLCHLLTLYVAYSLCYVINTWIPFEPKVLLIFTIVFLTIYFVVWGIVYLSIKATSKNCNAKLK
ncbi:MAG: DUF3021 domain-containing protein [Clostridia bacterium]|nr:DUF3021 domain-containing protein [Clostridia bacterium]